MLDAALGHQRLLRKYHTGMGGFVWGSVAMWPEWRWASGRGEVYCTFWTEACWVAWS